MISMNSTVKTNPCFRQSYTCFRYEGEIGESLIWLFLMIYALSTTISIKKVLSGALYYGYSWGYL